jgi:hypothetical protein
MKCDCPERHFCEWKCRRCGIRTEHVDSEPPPETLIVKVLARKGKHPPEIVQKFGTSARHRYYPCEEWAAVQAVDYVHRR